MIQVRPYHLLLSPSPNSQLKQQHCNILLEGKNPFDENILIIFLPASFCTVLWPVSFYSVGPEVQEYFTAHLRVALCALSKVISFSITSLFISFSITSLFIFLFYHFFCPFSAMKTPVYSRMNSNLCQLPGG